MFLVRKFYDTRMERMNAIIDELVGHVTGYVNLIGSATLPFPEVCHAQSLPAVACRVEGHLGSRLFPQTTPIDLSETIVVDHTRALFNTGPDYDISALPHSATQANQCVFRALLSKGSCVLGLGIRDGGHISHSFGLPDDCKLLSFPITSTGIDYDGVASSAEKACPAMIIAGGTSYPLSIDFERLSTIAESCGALLHADMAHCAPFIASRIHPPAFPFVDTATIDTGKNLRGPRGAVLAFRQKHAHSIRPMLFPRVQSSPDQSAIIAKAACLLSWDSDSLRTFASRMAHCARLLATELTKHGYPLIYGGTDTHLLLVDLRPVRITGRDAELRLEEHRILINRNQVPADTQSAWIGSGMRVSSTIPAILGYTDQDVLALGEVLAKVLLDDGNPPTGVIDQLLDRYHRSLFNNANEQTTA